MRVAAIDLGTNTFLLLIAEVENGQVKKVLHDEARVSRLGQAVHATRRFHPEALARAAEAFAQFDSIIRKFKPEKVLAFATSAARDVTNSNELLALASNYGIPVQIVSGEVEAETTFHGTIPENQTGSVFLVDVGGGSTEFIYGDGKGLKRRQSIDIGAVRLTEMFISKHPVPEHEFEKMNEYASNKVLTVFMEMKIPKDVQLIGVAGTATTLAAVDLQKPFSVDLIEGYKLTEAALASWLSRMSAMTVAERQSLPGMEPKRADVLIAGALILLITMKTFSFSEMQISTRGLRFGIAKQLGAGK
jgi:exopolyphosphatase/guanosine-5'-triphosphate,3'-diphosphate pyrophosphatase